MQILTLHARPQDLESQGWDSGICFNKALQVIFMHSKISKAVCEPSQVQYLEYGFEI